MPCCRRGTLAPYDVAKSRILSLCYTLPDSIIPLTSQWSGGCKEGSGSLLASSTIPKHGSTNSPAPLPLQARAEQELPKVMSGSAGPGLSRPSSDTVSCRFPSAALRPIRPLGHLFRAFRPAGNFRRLQGVLAVLHNPHPVLSLHGFNAGDISVVNPVICRVLTVPANQLTSPPGLHQPPSLHPQELALECSATTGQPDHGIRSPFHAAVNSGRGLFSPHTQPGQARHI